MTGPVRRFSERENAVRELRGFREDLDGQIRRLDRKAAELNEPVGRSAVLPDVPGRALPQVLTLQLSLPEFQRP